MDPQPEQPPRPHQPEPLEPSEQAAGPSPGRPPSPSPGALSPAASPVPVPPPAPVVPYAPPAAFVGEPHRGTAILVLGILSITFTLTFWCSPLGLGFGIAAWLMSRKDLLKMDQGIMDPAGRQISMGGKVCAIVGMILSLCMFVLAVLYLLIVGVFIAAAASS